MSEDRPLPYGSSAAAKTERYTEIFKNIRVVLAAEPDWYAALATTSSMLHDGFEYFSWTGFYRRLGPGSRSATPRSSNGKGSSPRGEDDCTLIIGPYQGSLGCLRIPHGRGVCGAAAVTRSTQLVDDVRTFPGYIACTGSAQSEIVVPVLHPVSGQPLAVLDVDSRDLAAFDEVDKQHLEGVCRWLAQWYFGGDQPTLQPQWECGQCGGAVNA